MYFLQYFQPSWYTRMFVFSYYSKTGLRDLIFVISSAPPRRYTNYCVPTGQSNGNVRTRGDVQ